AGRSAVQRQRSRSTICIAGAGGIEGSWKEWNSDGCGLEVFRISEKVPAIRDDFAGPADIGAGIHCAKGLGTIQADDGIELPALQQLAKTLPTGDEVGE